MNESKILKNFFEEQHRKFKKRAYTILRFTRGNHDIHSDHGAWMKHKAEAEFTASHPFGNPPLEDKKSPKD